MTEPSKVKMEFAVRMHCQACVNSVEKALKDVEGIHSYTIDLNSEQVALETSLPSQKVLDIIESSGRRAVLQGLGSENQPQHMGAAVAMISSFENGKNTEGVVRMVQLNERTCIIEGTVDGLTPGQHALRVHTSGDLSNGCLSCGTVLGKLDENTLLRLGNLGTIQADESGRAEFRKESETLKVWDTIGRSMVVHQDVTDDDINKRVGCGVIARSAGLFENAKRICACDGVTIWDERDRPLAGEGHRKPAEVAQV